MSREPRLRSGVSLSGERLHGVDVQRQELDGTELEDCALVKCSFRESTLRSCRFLDCSFESCDFSLARVPDSAFSGVVFRDCRIMGVNWTETRWRTAMLRDPFRFERCLMSHSTFLGMKLKGLHVLDSTAEDVDFRETDLSGADFSGTSLSGSMFAAADLGGSDFRCARAYTIDARDTRLKGARFSLPEAISLLVGLGVDVSGWED